MEIIIIILSIVIIVLLVILITRGSDRKLERIEQGVIQSEQSLLENKTYQDALNKSFNLILDETYKTREYLGMSEAKINRLNENMDAIHNIMVNTKQRGNFGEYQLYHLLSIYFGNSRHIYAVQYHLKNGKIADAALFLPGDQRVLIIDSKFPQENYIRILKDNSYKTEFKRNIKKHIDDIASKYINEETLNEAVMFIPSEAIYLYLCNHEPELVEYGHHKHVLMTSPSTLLGVVFTLINLTKDFQRSQSLERIEKEIITLKKDTDRLYERYEKAEKTLKTLNNQFQELYHSVVKIDHRVTKAYDGDIKK